MIFNEIYSLYYNALAKIIEKAQSENSDWNELASFTREIVNVEQAETILENLKQQNWQLIDEEGFTPLHAKPQMPLTTLQKRWLKSLSLDSRIALFDVDFSFLDDTLPLFTPDQYHLIDVCNGGDDYKDERYRRNFRILLKAVKEKQWATITIRNRQGNLQNIEVLPLKLEYSIKDDRFRLVCDGYKYHVFNLTKIVNVTSCDAKPWRLNHGDETAIQEMEIRLIDERNTLERFMTSFSGFDKTIVQTGPKEYCVHLRYNLADEIEMVIRILSFGPTVKVLGPESVVSQLKERIRKQKICDRR